MSDISGSFLQATTLSGFGKCRSLNIGEKLGIRSIVLKQMSLIAKKE